MNNTLPGTNLPLGEWVAGEPLFSLLDPVFSVSGGGLLLSQICEMTGLSPTTIQNWVKRGWIPNPQNKKYAPHPVARILIYSLLRRSMSLERIAWLLGRINGVVDDQSDDLIGEPALYDLLCTAILEMQRLPAVSPTVVEELAQRQLQARIGSAEVRRRLTAPLNIMLLSVCAADFMAQADTLCEKEVQP